MAIWNIRFYIDSETDQPHIYGHRVTEDEATEILLNADEDRHGEDGSRVAIGQTEAGRYLKIIYVPDPIPGSVFVITAYELSGKARAAFQRRRRRRK